MGYNSTIMILNDQLHDIKKNAQAVCDTIYSWCGSGSIPKNSWDQPRHLGFEICSIEHADVTSVIAVGGNDHSLLGRVWHAHHTDDHRIKLLKKIAKEFGYRLVKIPERRK